MNSLSFFHGNQLCQIAPERDGQGFIGLRNARATLARSGAVAKGSDRGSGGGDLKVNG